MPSAVSFRYARALVDIVAGDAATPGRDPRAVIGQLRDFQDLLAESLELNILFSTPAIPAAKKRAVLASLAPKAGLGQVAQNFLTVVLQHDRIPLLGEIIEAFEQLLNERLGVVVAQVTSARALDETEKQRLAAALRERTGKQVQMNFALDPHLIGGVLAQVGSTVYDGSVRGQIERLRSELAGRPGGAY
jgi:F-type H+-transporting ATPase subunit delta